MKFFISGEVAKEAGEGYGKLVFLISEQINKITEKSDYGNAIDKIAIIPTIFDLVTYIGLPYNERRLFKKKNKSADYRLAIDYETFIKTDDEGKKRLLIANIIKSIRDLKRKIKKKEEFDEEKLEKDILDLFKLRVEDLSL